MSYNNGRAIGNKGESVVCDFLVRHGYEIVKRNFTIRGGEIDIIALKGDVMAFVEVKTRKPNPLVEGEEAITYKKKQAIIRTADAYIEKYGGDEKYYRLDVAIVTMDNTGVKKIKYYAGAFDASK